MEKHIEKKIKLTYFDFYGRAEMIRMLLQYARVPFEDTRVDWMTGWPEEKKKINPPFGQLPLLELDGKTYAQSYCIMRLLSQKFGFYPKNQDDIFRCEMIADYNNDQYEEFFPYWGMSEPEKQKAFVDEFMKVKLPKSMKRLNALLVENYPHPFMVGNDYTMADFIVLAFLSVFVYHKDKLAVNADVIAAAPQIDKYWHIRSKDFKEYLERRKYSEY